MIQNPGNFQQIFSTNGQQVVCDIQSKVLILNLACNYFCASIQLSLSCLNKFQSNFNIKYAAKEFTVLEICTIDFRPIPQKVFFWKKYSTHTQKLIFNKEIQKITALHYKTTCSEFNNAHKQFSIQSHCYFTRLNLKKCTVK